MFATLAFTPDGTLYGLDARSGEVRTIDTTTGATTVVGTIIASGDGHGLAFDVDATFTLAGDRRLFAVDPVSFAATPGATLAFTPFCSFEQSIWGLTVDAGGTLLGVLRCDFWSYLVTIDRATGAIQIASSSFPISDGIAVTAGLQTGEHCGNCFDDDGDGLVDFDDPDCCGAGISVLDPTGGLLFRRKNGTSAVMLVGRLGTPNVLGHGDRMEDVHVQLHDETSGATFCSLLPAGNFVRGSRGNSLTFSAARSAVASARGIQRLMIFKRRTDVRFSIRGSDMPLFPLEPGELGITLAFHAPETRFSTSRCRKARVTTRTRGTAAVRFP